MWRKTILFGILGLGTLAAGGYGYLRMRSPTLLPAEPVQVRMTPESIARGQYIFTVLGDCDGCHSQRNWAKFSGPVEPRGRGMGWAFPKELGLPGNVVAPNITPDVETGIGAWTDGEKIRAIREGVSRDGRALFPMMPYKNFANMSDSDVEALVAYLNTIPAIRNPLPTTSLDFPVNFLITSVPAPSRNVSGPDAAVPLAFGRYLVTMAGCAECHTPMQRGEPIPGKEFAGGELFQLGPNKVVSANITPDPDTGIGKMSEIEFIERFHQYRKYTETGPPAVKPESFTLMPWIAFSKMSREELSAIYRYLGSVKPVNNSVETHPVAF